MAKYQVVVLGGDTEDPLEHERAEMADLDVEFVQVNPSSEGEAMEAVKEADAIMMRGGWGTEQVIKATEHCQVLAVYSHGFNHIDTDACTEKGIIVVQTSIDATTVKALQDHAAEGATEAAAGGFNAAYTASRPSSVLRSCRRAIIFLPDSRTFCLAKSKSPPDSWRAFLHSIIGRPVSSRSFMTIAAVMSAMRRTPVGWVPWPLL